MGKKVQRGNVMSGKGSGTEIAKKVEKMKIGSNTVEVKVYTITWYDDGLLNTWLIDLHKTVTLINIGRTHIPINRIAREKLPIIVFRSNISRITAPAPSKYIERKHEQFVNEVRADGSKFISVDILKKLILKKEFV
jgi:hypothetical protein